MSFIRKVLGIGCWINPMLINIESILYWYCINIVPLLYRNSVGGGSIRAGFNCILALRLVFVKSRTAIRPVAPESTSSLQYPLGHSVPYNKSRVLILFVFFFQWNVNKYLQLMNNDLMRPEICKENDWYKMKFKKKTIKLKKKNEWHRMRLKKKSIIQKKLKKDVRNSYYCFPSFLEALRQRV